ncbi:hypothetical protein V491_01369 [Pseudogymnoascus sp. VKM F-3775]|nr:hypothetical protein V491_01369 [Pseudogymnoascus sp. VKM F-3775]
MATHLYLRDQYDLFCERPRIVPRATMPPERRDEITRLNGEEKELARISKSLRATLKRNDALTSCINFASHRLLQNAGEGVTPVKLPKRPLVLYPARLDTPDEKEVLNARQALALQQNQVLTETLKQINQAILHTSIDPPATPGQPKVFYRVTTPNSHTSYDSVMGFYPARGLPDHDFSDPSKNDFHYHVGRRVLFESPYISLTTDPGFACEYGASRGGQSVYEIDAAKLRKMRIDIEPTSDIAARWGFRATGPDPGRLQHGTRSFWEAQFWVPDECIRRHSFTEFRDKCVRAGFNKGGTYEKLSPESPDNVHDELARLLHPQRLRRHAARPTPRRNNGNITPPPPPPLLPRPAKHPKPPNENKKNIAFPGAESATFPHISDSLITPTQCVARCGAAKIPADATDDKASKDVAPVQVQDATPADRRLDRRMQALSNPEAIERPVATFRGFSYHDIISSECSSDSCSKCRPNRRPRRRPSGRRSHRRPGRRPGSRSDRP